MNNNFHYQPQNSPEFSQMPPMQPQKTGKGFAIAALCLGIAAVICACSCCCYYLSIVLGIVGIVMACLAKKNNDEGKMPGMAVAGLILCIIGIILFAVMLGIESWMNSPEFEAFMKENMGEFWEEYESMYKEMYGELNGEIPLE